MIQRILISALVILVQIACNSKLSSKKEIREGTELLYGNISVEQLYFDYPDWKMIEDTYRPDEAIVEQLKDVDKNIEILVFLGTWCSDSEFHVPAFLKVLNQSTPGLSYKLNIWAVDRKKRLDNLLAQQYNLERVPTFIFKIDGKEIGRIIESPRSTIEQDIWEILQPLTAETI